MHRSELVDLGDDIVEALAVGTLPGNDAIARVRVVTADELGRGSVRAKVEVARPEIELLANSLRLRLAVHRVASVLAIELRFPDNTHNGMLVDSRSFVCAW